MNQNPKNEKENQTVSSIENLQTKKVWSAPQLKKLNSDKTAGGANNWFIEGTDYHS